LQSEDHAYCANLAAFLRGQSVDQGTHFRSLRMLFVGELRLRPLAFRPVRQSSHFALFVSAVGASPFQEVTGAGRAEGAADPVYRNEKSPTPGTPACQRIGRLICIPAFHGMNPPATSLRTSLHLHCVAISRIVADYSRAAFRRALFVGEHSKARIRLRRFIVSALCAQAHRTAGGHRG
jgi:hypothetical protein